MIVPETTSARLGLIHRIQNHLTKKFRPYSGKDTNGKEYDTIEEMWRHEGFFAEEQDSDENNNTGKKAKQDTAPTWYKKSHTYWESEENVNATIDGMLGGFAVLSDRDLVGSMDFLREVIDERPQLKERLGKDDDGSSRSCECGAGIGRITKGLMLPLGITNCDLVETSPRLLKAAPEYIGEESSRCSFICEGLQSFEPEQGTYDIIWIQWVIGYLTDWDACNFLHRMGNALREGGIIVIKDNTCNELGFMSDKDDSDITRSFEYMLALVKESGLKVVKIRWQEDFPDDIWPVPMIVITK